MPPYNKTRTIWHAVHRQVTTRQDGKGKWSVVVTFTRIGYSNETQERITEQLEEHVIMGKLGPQQAECLKRTIQSVCDSTYSQGYSAARRQHSL